LGERFSLPTNLNKKLAVHETIKDLESNIKSANIENQIRIRNTIIPQLHKILHLKSPKNLVDEKLISMTNYTKNYCRKNHDVIFTRVDKGNVTIALNKSIYIEKMEVALQDTNTYMIVKKDPSTTVEKKLNEIIKKWYSENYITKKEMLKLRSSDSVLPKAYGLPKIHKENTLYRIIVSSVNTSLYPIDKYLNKIISDNIPSSELQVKNSYELVDTLSNKFIPESHLLCSFDVVSLFTNIPLDLAIDSYFLLEAQN